MPADDFLFGVFCYYPCSCC